MGEGYPRQTVTLILEGVGDKAAVPVLLRRMMSEQQEYGLQLQAKPIIGQNISKLNRPGELERFISYAVLREGDMVLLLLDADDYCPKTKVKEFCDRVRVLNLTKRVAIGFIRSEFETFFLFCLDSIAQRYPEFDWRMSEWDRNYDFENIRGAKEFINNHMGRARAYKETRDQARFVGSLDLSILRTNSRSYQHLEKTIQWMQRRRSSMIYPSV